MSKSRKRSPFFFVLFHSDAGLRLVEWAELLAFRAMVKSTNVLPWPSHGVMSGQGQGRFKLSLIEISLSFFGLLGFRIIRQAQ